MKRLALIATLALAGPVAAQHAPLRDPMQPPAAASAPLKAPASAPPPPAVRHLLVIGDRRWVIDGGRKFGVGDLLGSARIERIDDSAVIVRQGGVLQRLPLFAGITKQPLAAAESSTAMPTRTALSAPAAGERPRSSRTSP